MATYKVKCSGNGSSVFLSMNRIYLDGIDCPHLDQKLTLRRFQQDPDVCLVCHQKDLKFKDQRGEEPTTDMTLYEIVPVDCTRNGNPVFLMRDPGNGKVYGIRCDKYNPGTAKPCEVARDFPNCIQESRDLQKIKL